MSIFRYLLSPICILHYFALLLSNSTEQELVYSDIEEMNMRYGTKGKGLIYWLIFFQPYRNLFYKRIPSSKYLRFILPEYPLFQISVKKEIGKNAFVLNHPYGTIINAKSIGSHFTCCQLTTIGNARHGRNELIPTIGNNVSLGANVTIIGDVHIGDNVIIGAGSVVVNDIPDNSVAVGNPAKVIKKISD